jgi:hypothetical protein
MQWINTTNEQVVMDSADVKDESWSGVETRGPVANGYKGLHIKKQKRRIHTLHTPTYIHTYIHTYIPRYTHSLSIDYAVGTGSPSVI